MNDEDAPFRRLRNAAILITGIGVLLSLLSYFATKRIAESSKSSATSPKHSTSDATKSGERFVGSEILKHYADPTTKPEEDLTWMSRALDNFSLLVKGDDPLPLGANEDIADALRGRNKAHLRFLPDDSPIFDKQGRIVDRWGTPLYFHAESRDRLDIRSAGQDKQMWTADDLHRRQDGSFLRGDALLAPSLFDAKRPLDPRR